MFALCFDGDQSKTLYIVAGHLFLWCGRMQPIRSRRNPDDAGRHRPCCVEKHKNCQGCRQQDRKRKVSVRIQFNPHDADVFVPIHRTTRTRTGVRGRLRQKNSLLAATDVRSFAAQIWHTENFSLNFRLTPRQCTKREKSVDRQLEISLTFPSSGYVRQILHDFASTNRWNFSVGEHEISLVKSERPVDFSQRMLTAETPSAEGIIEDSDDDVSTCSDETGMALCNDFRLCWFSLLVFLHQDLTD